MKKSILLWLALLVSVLSWGQDYEVYVSVYGDGYITINGVAYYGGESFYAYEGESITMKAYEDPGWRFSQWEDGSSDWQRTIYVDGDVYLEAYFEEIPTYTVYVSISGDGYITIDGVAYFDGDTYETDYPETLTLQAYEDAGWRFSGWDDGSTDLPRTITADGDIYITAYFEEIPTYTVYVSISGDGYITIDGVAYYDGDTYETDYPETLTLQAYEDAGWRFSGWDDGSTDLPRTITADGDIYIAAYFEEIPQTPRYYVYVEASPSDGGWVTVSDQRYIDELESPARRSPADWDHSPGSIEVEKNTTVYLYAEANRHYRFIGWSDGVTDAYRTVTVTQDITFTAEFEAISYYRVYVEASPDEGGWATVSDEWYIYMGGESPARRSPADWDYSPGYLEVEEGTTVYLVAGANDGYRFTGWSDGVTASERTVTVTQDIAFTAQFELIPQTPRYYVYVEASPSVGGWATVSDKGYIYMGGGESPARRSPADWDSSPGYLEVEEGTTVYLAAGANDGYRFTGWSDGVTASERTVTATQDIAFTAEFESLYGDVTVYAVNTYGWSQMYAYVWGDNGELAGWHGEEMTPTGIQIDGMDLYSYTFSSKYTMIIFNDGGYSQTADLTVDASRPYWYDGQWYASLDGQANPFIYAYVARDGGTGLSVEYTSVATAVEDTVCIRVRGGYWTEPLQAAIHSHSGAFTAVENLCQDGADATMDIRLRLTETNTDAVDTLVLTTSGVEQRMLLRADVYITHHAGTQGDPLDGSELYALQQRNCSAAAHYLKLGSVSLVPETLFARGVVEEEDVPYWWNAANVGFNLYAGQNKEYRVWCDIYLDNSIQLTQDDLLPLDTVTLRLIEPSDRCFTTTGYLNADIVAVENGSDEELELLRQAYAKMGNGAGWYLTWDLSSRGSMHSSYGLTFSNGHLVAIDLAYNGLQGTLPVELFQLPYLESLDVDNNQLTAVELPETASSSLSGLAIAYNLLSGNLGAIAAVCPGLTWLDASGNSFSEITPVISPNVTVLNYGSQTIEQPVDLFVKEPVTLEEMRQILPNIFFYDHSAQDYSRVLDWTLSGGRNESSARLYGSYNANDEYCYTWDNNYQYVSHDFRFTELDGYKLLDENYNIAILVNVTYLPADVNFTGTVDITDVQGTINYMFNRYDEWLPFNFSAADMNTDERVNILDLVTVIDRLLNAPVVPGQEIAPRNRRTPGTDYAEARLWWENGDLHLRSDKDVAALDIAVESGSVTWLLDGFTLASRTDGGIQHTVAYSLKGNVLAAGEDHVIARSADSRSRLLKAVLSDHAARVIETDADGGIQMPTADGRTETDRLSVRVEGGKVAVSAAGTGLTRWCIYDATGKLVASGGFATDAAGQQAVATLPATGVYVIVAGNGTENKVTEKIIIK